MIVLAADIGGTNSRLAVYKDGAPLVARSYASAAHSTFEEVMDRFLEEARDAFAGASARPDRACLAVAGPIEDGVARVTNLPWRIDAREIARRAGIAKVTLMNDFHAAAVGVAALGPEHLVPLGGGARESTGPIAVVGPGTGLGEAFLCWSPAESRYRALPSEGGHVQFAPRVGIESALFRYLAEKYGRVSYERVLSGPGLEDIFAFLMSEPACRALALAETQRAVLAEDPAAVVARQALAGKDPIAVMALNLFCSVLGGLAGDLALMFLATGGVFVAGGIAPRILPFLGNGIFRQAFEAKGRLQPVVRKIPAFVVTHPEVGILGAAIEAASE